VKVKGIENVKADIALPLIAILTVALAAFTIENEHLAKSVNPFRY
jgi:hypothetical protein